MSHTVITAAHFQGTTCKSLPDYQPGYELWKYEELKRAEDNEHAKTNRTVYGKSFKRKLFQ